MNTLIRRYASTARLLASKVKFYAEGAPIDWRIHALRFVQPHESTYVGPRLNLVLTTVEPGSTFGGISTALQLHAALVREAGCASRIITLKALSPDIGEVVGHGRIAARRGDEPSLVSAATDPSELAVGPRDVFVATHWTTADAVARIRDWQREAFGEAPRHVGYVIQDFEPGFFPFSAEYLMALETYKRVDSTIAMFNTSQLRNFFHAQGLTFDHEHEFEPRIPEALRAARASAPHRQRRLVVYGRPETPRNAFPLIVGGLRAWHQSDPQAGRWECVSAGQPHGPIDLGGRLLTSLGKLDLPRYADLLRNSAVGLSLMVSPHPSYPPLEMAHMGMLVVTNGFGGKDMSTWHENITTLDGASEEAVALALAEACSRFDADPSIGDQGTSHYPQYTSSDPQFAFAAEVAALLTRPAADKQWIS